MHSTKYNIVLHNMVQLLILHSCAILKYLLQSMIKLNELFHNIVQSPNCNISQHDEITKSYIAQHGEITKSR